MTNFTKTVKVKRIITIFAFMGIFLFSSCETLKDEGNTAVEESVAISLEESIDSQETNIVIPEPQVAEEEAIEDQSISFEEVDELYVPAVITNKTSDLTVQEGRTPAPMQYDPEIVDYDAEDTIYLKTYYDDFSQGRILHFDYHLRMEIREELEDYFVEESDIYYWDYLASMFYDNRTIEMDEKELEHLFLDHGCVIYFHNAEFQDFHLRFIEIAEKEGLSIFPVLILMQTWDNDFIYLQDISGPIIRKIRDLMVVDKDGVWQLIVHSSGFSKELIPEEELSFWEFTGTYWILVPMELEIDTTNAFSQGPCFYPDIDRDELFEATFYRDGIAYRSSMQPINKWGTENAYRLGKMEVVKENKSFRLYTVDKEEETSESLSYIQYTIK